VGQQAHGRYRAEGEGAFEPRSRRPLSSPNVAAPVAIELIVRPRKEPSGQGWLPPIPPSGPVFLPAAEPAVPWRTAPAAADASPTSPSGLYDRSVILGICHVQPILRFELACSPPGSS
jgi:hypothetical protein